MKTTDKKKERRQGGTNKTTHETFRILGNLKSITFMEKETLGV